MRHDIKPKLETESPTNATQTLAGVLEDPTLACDATAMAMRVKEEVAQGPEQAMNTEYSGGNSEPQTATVDVKPDVRDLEALMGSLGIDHGTPSPHHGIPMKKSPRGTPERSAIHPKGEPNTWTPAPRLRKRDECATPLFLPDDSLASMASIDSPALDCDHLSDLFDSPARSVRQIVPHKAPVPATIDRGVVPGLFSDDSPPPAKPRSWSPAPSASSDGEDDRRFSPSPSPSITNRRLSTASIRPPQAPTHIALSPAPRAVAAGPSRTPAKRRAFLDFLDKVEKSDTEEEVLAAYDEDDSGSLGSLKDFIVDDDEVDYCSLGSQDEDDFGDEDYDEHARAWPTRRHSVKTEARYSVEVDASDSDIEEVRETGRREGTPHRLSHASIDSYLEDEAAVLSENDSRSRSLALGSDDDDDDDEEVDSIAEERDVVTTRPSKTGTFLDEFAGSDDDTKSTSGSDEDLISRLDDLDLRASKPSRKIGTAKKASKAPKWEVERVWIAQEVFDDLDKRVFDCRLGPSGAGVKIVWNKRLLTTAGTAQRKR